MLTHLEICDVANDFFPNNLVKVRAEFEVDSFDALLQLFVCHVTFVQPFQVSFSSMITIDISAHSLLTYEREGRSRRPRM